MKFNILIGSILTLVIFLLILYLAVFSKDREPVDYVDPFIGTDFYAHTFPGAALPFAMVHLSPDVDTTGWTYSSGYHYWDNSIMGFSHTHYSGSGWANKGEILIMPTIGNILHIYPGSKDNPDEGYRSRFSHENEIASPGYYMVYLQDYHIKVELTTTRRVGMHKYTFPKTNDAHVIIDLGHAIGHKSSEKSHINFVNNREIEGCKSGAGAVVYFVAQFNKPFAAYGTWDKSYNKPETNMKINSYKTAESGSDIGGFVNYTTLENEEILVKVALSYVSIKGARKNLLHEIPDWDFQQVREDARRAWNSELKTVVVSGGTDDQKQIFYTALYHALLAQYISSDVDGHYYGMDDKIHRAEGHDFYPSFFAWDTYRSEQPLMTLVAPDHIDDMLKSIESKVRNYGWLPAQHVRNNFGQGMVGDHLVAVIVDAYLKGFRDFDVNLLYDAMRRKALKLPISPLDPSAGRAGLDYYKKLGYIPADRLTESVSNTLELAYDDWCIAQMARVLGKDQDYQLFSKRARYYINVFDHETGFMRPRLYDGSWLPFCQNEPKIITEEDHSYYSCFDPLWIGIRPNRHFTESNAWQYLWFVPHDVEGLIGLMGGPEEFNAKLDSCLNMSPEVTGPNYVGVVGTIGQYVHGNQPSHHVMYLYNYAGQPWKTQKYVRKVMDDLYSTGPGGICGNEDMGSLSSWYVFSALGFYPVCPGENKYIIGSPIFDEAVLKLTSPYPEGTFVINANNNSKENKYIQSARLNGQPYNKTWITHDNIVNGGILEFEMGPKPNKDWGN